MYTSYKRSSKWLGIIDYKALFVLVIYIFIIIKVLDFINLDFEKSIYIFLLFSVPVVSVVFINVNDESTINIFLFVLNFIIKRKIYVDKNFVKISGKKYK